MCMYIYISMDEYVMHDITSHIKHVDMQNESRVTWVDGKAPL